MPNATTVTRRSSRGVSKATCTASPTANSPATGKMQKNILRDAFKDHLLVTA